MAKSIALFLDGTWNDVSTETNVWRLYNLSHAADAPGRQLSRYDPGVGSGRLEKLRGGALGYGLSRNVLEAYEYVRTHYEDGDALFVFGFSRGAYTARSLTGLIAKCGLLRPGADMTPEQIYHRYQLDKGARPIWTIAYLAERREVEKGDDRPPPTKEELALLRASRRVPIRFIGLWDTVGALGIPFGNIPGLSRRSLRFHHTRLSNLFEHAYQALAIDEHREAFQPTLWTRFTPKTPDLPGPQRAAPVVEQRWFAGAHADVGGGCPGRLPSIPLRWIADKATAAGLKLAKTPLVETSAHLDGVSDSFAEFMFGLYRLGKLNRRFHRTIGAAAVEKPTGRVETVNETIDASVFERVRADPRYRPPSLTRWAAGRMGPLETLSGTARAGGSDGG